MGVKVGLGEGIGVKAGLEMEVGVKASLEVGIEVRVGVRVEEGVTVGLMRVGVEIDLVGVKVEVGLVKIGVEVGVETGSAEAKAVRVSAKTVATATRVALPLSLKNTTLSERVIIRIRKRQPKRRMAVAMMKEEGSRCPRGPRFMGRFMTPDQIKQILLIINGKGISVKNSGEVPRRLGGCPLL